MIVPVILSGGRGTRLWPLSRTHHPKQLLPLCGEQSMLQQTLLRLQGGDDFGPALVVCNTQHRFLVAEQLCQIDQHQAQVILEPSGRNTAPAAAVAALLAADLSDDPLVLILPADHVVEDCSALHQAIRKGKSLAEAGHLVTFGIQPTRAETGYGYIQSGQSLDGGWTVAAFVEKPQLEMAQQYVDSGEYYWNSGMFLFRASHYLTELEQYHPEMVATCRAAVRDAQRDLDFIRLDVDHFSQSESVSIDYAVMEKTSAAAMVPLDAGWNDVGSWSALWDVGVSDDHGNVCRGDVVTDSTQNSYLYSSSRLLTAVGLQDMVVVESSDAVFVAPKERACEVQKIVAQLESEQRHELIHHPRVNRPWGSYECIDRSDRYQVKRIRVNPGSSLSLQLHHHRAEHWIVVTGTARITRGDQVSLLTENQSTYIPLGEKHQLENPGQVMLELIEVQSGSYLGEDDIVRFGVQDNDYV